VRLLLCALGPGAFPTRQLPDDVAAGVSRKQRLGRVACVRALRSLPGLPGYLHAWRFASRTARTWARAREGRRMHAETTPTGWWALTVNLTLHRRWAPPRHTRAAGRPQLGPEPPRPPRWRQVPGRRAGRRRAAERGPQQRRARVRGRRGAHGRRALAVHVHAARGRLLPADACAARRAGRRQPLLRAGGRPHTPCVSSFAGQEIRLVADGLFTPTLPASYTGARVHECMMACHLFRQVGCQRGRHVPGACSTSRPKKQPRVCWHF